MIISNFQKHPQAGSTLPAKTSPASKSAAPEIYATHNRIQQHTFPFEDGQSTLAGYDVKDWLIAKHPIADDPIPPRSSDPRSN